ncbi:MAG TPA: hypothetical protein VJ278_04435 [Chthoniobacterales bacterium]|nr:hypothetical protein [Chthoniobacterales bacterium]
MPRSAIPVATKERFGETPKPTRETRALPGSLRYKHFHFRDAKPGFSIPP